MRKPYNSSIRSSLKRVPNEGPRPKVALLGHLAIPGEAGGLAGLPSPWAAEGRISEMKGKRVELPWNFRFTREDVAPFRSWYANRCSPCVLRRVPARL